MRVRFVSGRTQPLLQQHCCVKLAFVNIKGTSMLLFQVWGTDHRRPLRDVRTKGEDMPDPNDTTVAALHDRLSKLELDFDALLRGLSEMNGTLGAHTELLNRIL